MDKDTIKAETLNLDTYVPALLTWVNNKFWADASRVYRDRFGIGIADWRVLAYLSVKGKGTGAQMSAFLGMDKAAISRSVRTLTQSGHAAVANQSGRKSELELTAKGTELYNEILGVALQREATLLTDFTPSERETLLRLLHKMHGNIPDVVALNS